MKKRLLSFLLATVLLASLFALPAQGMHVVTTGALAASSSTKSLAITGQPKTVTVASGKTAKVTVAATGEGLRYQWYYKDGKAASFSKTTSFSGNSYHVTMNANRSGRQVYCVVTDRNGKSVTSEIATLYMEKAVKVTAQPKSVTGPNGTAAKIKVSATGEGLTYKWYYKNKGASKFSLTKSFTGNTYSTTINSDRDGREIYCLITDKYGCTIRTNTVRLNMGNPATITGQPKSVVVAKGAQAKVTVKATGDGLSYKWYFKNATAHEFTETSSYTGKTYTLPMTPERSGREVYCVVTDKFGNSCQTDTVSLRMSKSVVIRTQPASVRVAAGETAKVSFQAKGDGLSYQWYLKDTDANRFSRSTTLKGNAYQVVMSENRAGRQVYCVVTDKYGCSVATDIVTLDMKPVLKILSQPKSVKVAGGEKASATVSAQGDGLSYQWYIKSAKGSQFTKSSITKATYSATMNSDVHGRQAYCVITDSSGKTVTSNTVTFTMKGLLEIQKQPVSVTVQNKKTAKVSVSAIGDGLRYQWYIKNNGATKFTKSSVTKATYSVTMSPTVHARQVYCVITNATGNTATTKTVTLSMEGIAQITKQPTSVAVVKGEMAKVSLEAQGKGLTYQWYVKSVGSTAFSKSSNTTATYKATMSDAVNGRQIYCVVKDQAGNSVTSNIVTLSMKTALKILTQPQSITVVSGKEASVTVKAQGDGLSYQWYIKNAGDSAFKKTSTTSATYKVTMSSSVSGRQVYCVVKDKYGSSVTSNTVTLSAQTALKITTQPQSVSVESGKDASVKIVVSGDGVSYQWYAKNAGESAFKKASTTSATYKATMSDSVNGRQLYCVVTDKYGNTAKSNTVTLSLLRFYTITVNTGVASPTIMKVKAGEAYTLPKPTKEGYTLVGWIDEKGKDFSSTGTASRNATVSPVWVLEGTDTLSELISRVNAGTKQIRITGNITVNQPIYVSHDITIFADKDYTIKRDPSYDGDLFVVGMDKNGKSTLLLHRQATLTLGGGEGTLTIDGNKGNMKTDVVGSAIFNCHSGIINLYDGVRIANHNKAGNKRINDFASFLSQTIRNRAGGAAIQNISGTINMYGGSLENNSVLTKLTSDAEMTNCGGAIYNRGNFYMYGGTISGNKAYKGGALYNEMYAFVEAGTITKNTAGGYGGAISSSGSADAHLFAGSTDGKALTISNNSSEKAGGAIYSSLHSPIVVLGKTTFSNNHSDTQGGAIYTSGALTARNTTFTGNNSTNLGGAIHQCYNNADYSRRNVQLENCTFKDNTSATGGAIALNSTVSTGTYAVIKNSTFAGNKATSSDFVSGTYGAIYAQSNTSLTNSGNTFSK